jgi:hypothetical protein
MMAVFIVAIPHNMRVFPTGHQTKKQFKPEERKGEGVTREINQLTHQVFVSA